jgi:hypothetical protein
MGHFSRRRHLQRMTAEGRRRSILYRAEIGSSGWEADLRPSRGEWRGFAESGRWRRSRAASKIDPVAITFSGYPGGKPISGATFGTSQDASRR